MVIFVQLEGLNVRELRVEVAELPPLLPGRRHAAVIPPKTTGLQKTFCAAANPVNKLFLTVSPILKSPPVNYFRSCRTNRQCDSDDLPDASLF